MLSIIDFGKLMWILIILCKINIIGNFLLKIAVIEIFFGKIILEIFFFLFMLTINLIWKIAVIDIFYRTALCYIYIL